MFSVFGVSANPPFRHEHCCCESTSPPRCSATSYRIQFGGATFSETVDTNFQRTASAVLCSVGQQFEGVLMLFCLWCLYCKIPQNLNQISDHTSIPSVRSSCFFNASSSLLLPGIPSNQNSVATPFSSNLSTATLQRPFRCAKVPSSSRSRCH